MREGATSRHVVSAVLHLGSVAGRVDQLTVAGDQRSLETRRARRRPRRRRSGCAAAARRDRSVRPAGSGPEASSPKSNRASIARSRLSSPSGLSRRNACRTSISIRCGAWRSHPRPGARPSRARGRGRRAPRTAEVSTTSTVKKSRGRSARAAMIAFALARPARVRARASRSAAGGCFATRSSSSRALSDSDTPAAAAARPENPMPLVGHVARLNRLHAALANGIGCRAPS